LLKEYVGINDRAITLEDYEKAGKDKIKIMFNAYNEYNSTG